MRRILLLIGFIFTCSSSLYAQVDTWIGFTGVHKTFQTTYSYTLSTPEGTFVSPAWHITGGAVNSWSLSPDSYTITANVTWTTVGTGTLYFIEDFDNVSPTLSVTVVTCPSMGTPTGLTSSSTVCNGATVTLSATPGTNGNLIRWWASSAETQLLLTGSPVKTAPLAATTTFYASSISTSNRCESATASTFVTMTVNPSVSSAFVSQPNYVYGPETTTLTSPVVSGVTTNWRNAAGDSLLHTGSSFTTPVLYSAKTYKVFNVDNTTSCPGPATMYAVQYGPLGNAAYMKHDVVRIKGIKYDAQVTPLTTSQKSTSFTYVDGLGRVNQTIAIASSPGGKDIIQPVEYDSLGHTTKDYLPYTIADGSGSRHANYATEQHSFYMGTSKVAADSKAYAASRYENSPLGRAMEQGSVGSAVQTGSGHTKRVYYNFNAAANGADSCDVRQFNSDLTSTVYYPAKYLSIATTIDEDGHKDITYRDGNGNSVCHKQQVSDTVSGSFVNYLQTYYVYNDINKLLYIIPPSGYVAISNNSWTVTQSIKDQYLHQFRYDAKGRLTQKKTPGQAWTYYVYDKFNRLVLTQDGNLRASNQWAFVKYDYAGRSVMSGIYKNTTATTLSGVQSIVTGQYTSSAWYEDRGSSLQGYTNVSFPTQNADASALTITSVNYFDNYDFDNNGTADYRYDSTQIPGRTSRWIPTGMATCSKRLLLDTTATVWLVSVVFYDSANNTIQTRSNNHLSLTVDNLTTMSYDFEGKVIKTITYHNAGGSNQQTILQQPVYDTQGRLYQLYHQTGTDSLRLIAQYEYNELGQMWTRSCTKQPAAFYRAWTTATRSGGS